MAALLHVARDCEPAVDPVLGQARRTWKPIYSLRSFAQETINVAQRYLQIVFFEVTSRHELSKKTASSKAGDVWLMMESLRQSLPYEMFTAP